MLTAVLSVLVTTTVVLHHAPMSCRHDFPSSSPELCGVAGVIIIVTAGTQQGPRCPAPPRLWCPPSAPLRQVARSLLRHLRGCGWKEGQPNWPGCAH